MLRTVSGSAASPRNSTIPNGAGNLASGGNAPVATASGNFPRLAGARPASSASPGGSSTWKRDFSGNGPSNTAPDTNGSPGMSSGRTGARAVPSAARRTILEARDRSTGAEKSSRIGRMGRQSPPFLSRSQRKTTVKAGRALNVIFRVSSEATPPAVRTPAPHRRTTFAPGGNACVGARTRIRPSADGVPLSPHPRGTRLDQRLPLLPLDDPDPDRLLHPGDGKGHVGEDRRLVGLRVEQEEERLVLVDAIVPVVGDGLGRPRARRW